MRRSRPRCEHCGAPVPRSAEPTAALKCSYCEHELPPPEGKLLYLNAALGTVNQSSDPPRRSASQVDAEGQHQSSSSGFDWDRVNKRLGAFFTACLCILLAYLPFTNHCSESPEPARLGGSDRASRSVLWAWASALPTSLDDDGVEDFIGLFSYERDPGRLRVGAFDGRTFKPRWHESAFQSGSYTKESTHVALAAGRVILSFGEEVVLYDVRSGGYLIRLTLGFETDEICVGSDGLVELIGRSGERAKLDPRSLRLVSKSRRRRNSSKASSPIRRGAGDCLRNSATTGTTGRGSATPEPTIPDLRPDDVRQYRVHVDGLNAFGISEQEDVLYGYSTKARELSWTASSQSLFGDGRPLFYEWAKGRLYWKTARELFAVDTGTGKKLWRTSVPGRTYTLSDSRMYIAWGGRLSVIDIKSGEVVGVVGR